MKTQFDYQKRVVSLENLEAMCEHVSGTCHRYWVESVSRSRVKVGYSNPDEYANDRPMFAVFPCYPSGHDTVSHEASPAIVLDFLNIIHDSWDGEGWQSFQILLDCPVLWRNPNNNEWQAETK